MIEEDKPKQVVAFANTDVKVMTRCTPTEIAKDLPTVLQYLDQGSCIITLDDEDGTPTRWYSVDSA